MNIGNGVRYSAGIGIVTIPKNKDRDKYIGKSYRIGKITILDSRGPIIQNCIVSKHIFNNLIFPEDPSKFGSSVCWVNIPPVNTVVVIAVLDKGDQMELMKEGAFRISKDGDGSIVEIRGNGLTGELFISVQGEKGDIHINTSNDFNLGIKGSYNKDVVGDININVEGNETHNIDGSFNIKADDGYNFGEATEAGALGDTLKSSLEEILDAIGAVDNAASAGISSAGGTYLSVAALIEKAKIGLEEILSKNFKLD